MDVRTQTRRGFSLIELVIVVMILGIIGSIAIPRMSRGAAGAADTALVSDLAVLRNAVDLFAAEHGGTYPVFADMPGALTTYSDVVGTDIGTKSTTRIYGPYLRAIPQLPVGTNKTQSAFVATEGGTTAGWVYDDTTGQVTANLGAGEKDAADVPYNSY